MFQQIRSTYGCCVVGVLIGSLWLGASALAGRKLEWLHGCAAIISTGNQYQLVKTEQGYNLHDTMKEGEFIHIPRAWLEPAEVIEKEKEAFVSSLNWNASVSDFSLDLGGRAVHLSSYQIQERGSAQMAVGRDVFLQVAHDGTLYPGLMDLGITQERGRSQAGWFAKSHRFIASDVNEDRYRDIAVIKDEVRPKFNAQGMPEGGVPAIIEHPIRWYVYQPASHSWVYKAEFDDKPGYGCSIELPLISMAMTPVDFVKQIYRIK